MPGRAKSTSTDTQQRQAAHIEEGYAKRGVPEDEAERRAWATVNTMTEGGKTSVASRGKKIITAPAKQGGHKGGAAAVARATEDQARPGTSVCQACTHAIPSIRGTRCQEIPR